MLGLEPRSWSDNGGKEERADGRGPGRGGAGAVAQGEPAEALARRYQLSENTQLVARPRPDDRRAATADS